MSEINEELIKKLSRLSRIELKEDEIPAFSKNLKRVIDYFKGLEEVDLSDLSPYSHVEQQGIHSLREDVVTSLLPREAFLENAPDQIGGMIKVPPVLKER